MKYQLFQENTVKKAEENIKNGISIEELIEIQAKMLVDTYHTICFDIKQLQKVLGIGETNAYRLVRSGKLPSQTIGKRKIVPVSALAQFLVMGEKKLDKRVIQRSNTPTIL